MSTFVTIMPIVQQKHYYVIVLVKTESPNTVNAYVMDSLPNSTVSKYKDCVDRIIGFYVQHMVIPYPLSSLFSAARYL